MYVQIVRADYNSFYCLPSATCCLCMLQVLVIIDAKPKDLGLPTEAYIAVEEVHDVSLDEAKLFC